MTVVAVVVVGRVCWLVLVVGSSPLDDSNGWVYAACDDDGGGGGGCGGR